MKYASIGTVSHGTLLTADLLDAFANALEDAFTLNLCELDKRPVKERQRLDNLIHEAREWRALDEDASKAGVGAEEVAELGSTLVTELEDALAEFAAPYCYFGTLEGDGSDFGYWPSMEQISELPNVNDSDEARALGEDSKFVNDHGNVTVYDATGKVILEIV